MEAVRVLRLMRVWPDHVSAGVACVPQQLEALETGGSGGFLAQTGLNCGIVRDWVPFTLYLGRQFMRR